MYNKIIKKIIFFFFYLMLERKHLKSDWISSQFLRFVFIISKLENPDREIKKFKKNAFCYYYLRIPTNVCPLPGWKSLF